MYNGEVQRKRGAACLEQVFGVQQAGVDLRRRLEAQADHEDLSRGIPGGCWLSGLHFAKQLIERVQKCSVVL